MKRAIIFSTILSAFLMTGNARAADQTVTIYFCGTTMNSAMWQPGSSPFGRPETVATLHHLQKAGTEYANHHKGIVDGILLIDALNPTLEDDLGGRGWNAILAEAVAIVEPVLGDCAGKCITLNLVGFSRGAVSTMHMAHALSNNTDYAHIKNKIKKINILAFDPVPGDAIMKAGIFNLPPNVAYLGFYSVDERTVLFAPVFPNPPLASDPADPLIAFYTVPGSHETMVGNTLVSGKHFGAHDDDNLDHVSRTLKIIATEIMGSSGWGHVRFYLSYDPLYNLDWYAGETDIDVLRQRFVDKVNAMYASPLPANYYPGMHIYSYFIFLESWYLDEKFCFLAVGGARHYPRCAFFRPYWFYDDGYSGPVGFADWAIINYEYSVPAPQLRVTSNGSYDIWELIAKHGSLDVDADFFDYRSTGNGSNLVIYGLFA